MNLEGKVVIVTGASSGIGRQTALLLGRKKASVVLVARRKDRIEAAAKEIEASGGKAVAMVADVAEESAVNAVAAQTLERFGRIDVLICNAGTGLLASVAETTPEQLKRVMRTNFWGTYYGIRSVLPAMQKQGSGQIVAVASMSGRRGAPLKAAYCASKFAQIGLMESLRMELYGSNILCTLIFPGFTDTEFFDSLDNPSGHKYQVYGAKQKPEEVAQAIVDALGRRKPEVITQKLGRLQLIVQAAAPSVADRLAAGRKKKVIEGAGK